MFQCSLCNPGLKILDDLLRIFKSHRPDVFMWDKISQIQSINGRSVMFSLLRLFDGLLSWLSTPYLVTQLCIGAMFCNGVSISTARQNKMSPILPRKRNIKKMTIQFYLFAFWLSWRCFLYCSKYIVYRNAINFRPIYV